MKILSLTVKTQSFPFPARWSGRIHRDTILRRVNNSEQRTRNRVSSLTRDNGENRRHGVWLREYRYGLWLGRQRSSGTFVRRTTRHHLERPSAQTDANHFAANASAVDV